eukprot:622649_1
MLYQCTHYVQVHPEFCIFFCKQSYKTWKSNGRAVTISSSPKITWIGALNEANEGSDVTQTTQVIITNRNDIRLSSKPHIALEAYIADMERESVSEICIPVVPRLKTPEHSVSEDLHMDQVRVSK